LAKREGKDFPVSTAALQHDGPQLPDDAEPLLQEGYYCTTLTMSGRTIFNAVHKSTPHTRLVSVEVWHNSQSYSGHIQRSVIQTRNHSSLEPHSAVCLAELLGMAAVFCEVLDQDIEAALERERARREREREEREAERKRQQEERERLAAEAEKPLADMKEFLQWNLEEKIRYKRRHRRSVVFGTVREVRANRWGTSILHTISERGNPMDCPLNDIIWLEHQEPGKKKYTRIFTHPDQSGLIGS
jgi:hypothetical protein